MPLMEWQGMLGFVVLQHEGSCGYMLHNVFLWTATEMSVCSPSLMGEGGSVASVSADIGSCGEMETAVIYIVGD